MYESVTLLFGHPVQYNVQIHESHFIDVILSTTKNRIDRYIYIYIIGQTAK